MTFNGDIQRVTASHQDNDVDEIVINSVDIHLERMQDGAVWFALYRPGSETRLTFWLHAVKKDDLHVGAYWEGPSWSDVSNEIRQWHGRIVPVKVEEVTDE